jgi:protein AATF/BFR2
MAKKVSAVNGSVRATKSSKSSKKMLSDKILEKMNKPKMADYDIEDEEFNNRGGDQDNDDDDEDDDDVEDQKAREELAKREHYVSVEKSRLRDDRLEASSKYTGTKVGRSELFEDRAEEVGSDAEGDDSGEDEAGDESDDDLLADVTDSEAEEQDDDEEEEQFEAEEENSDEFDNEQGDDDDEEDEDEDLDDEDEAFKRERIEKLLDSEKKQILSRLSTSAKSDALKGYVILKQNAQYDRILDSRIKFQKAVISSNNLPINHKVFEEAKTEQTDSILESTEDKLYTLIERLIRLRSKQLHKDGLVKNEVNVSISKKRKLSELLEANKKIDDAMAPVAKSVLTKWSNRVQSASGVGALNQGKFKVVNQSVWSQVNNQLGDLERLVKKTKINRRNAKPLGYEEELTKENEKDDEDAEEDDEDDDEIKAAGLSNIDKSLQINPYIFDDDDFYRLLLNDMINKKLDQKQANNSAVFMLSKNKMQKSYDRMATKGRKLKYTVQESLVQFEIPRRKYYSWGDDQIDELFAGLFGMRIDMDDSDNDLSDSENKGLDEQKVEDISALKQSGVKLFG